MESETKLKFFTPEFLFLKIEFHFPNLLCDLLRNPLRLNQDGIGEGGRGGGGGGGGELWIVTCNENMKIFLEFQDT